MNLRFEFSQYLNLNLLGGSGSGILLNLIPEPQVWNQVQTRFRRFRNQTMASLMSSRYAMSDSLTHIYLMIESTGKTHSRNGYSKQKM